MRITRPENLVPNVFTAAVGGAPDFRPARKAIP